MKIKVLPLTIAACGLLIGLKTAEVAGAFNKAPEKLAQTKKAESIVLSLAEPKSGAPKPKKEEGDAHSKSDGKSDKKDEPKNVHDVAPAENISKYNDSEKLLLEKLASRRAELEAWEKELGMKEQLITASSKKLDNKLAELKKLKDETDALLKLYNEQDDKKIRSLVKMYEAMKPASAAQILEQMQMGILLEIVDKMAEKKASLILSKMSPRKAKDITEMLAKQRSLAQVN